MKKYVYQVNLDAQDAPGKVLRAVGRGKHVLEVGCASGVQTRILKEQLACTVTGIEINPSAAADASKYCERIIVGDLESMDLSSQLGDSKFEVIIIADVLEHLHDPLKVLSKLRNHLHADGYVVASIPNIVHAALILQMAHGRFDYRPYGLLDDTHVRFFTLKTIYRLFEDSGLTILDVDRVGRSIEATEFSMHVLSPDESTALDFIQHNNPEWETYQFIVKAVARSSEVKLQTYGQLEALDQLKDAELTRGALVPRVRKLEGEIAWIESRPTYRVLTMLKRILSLKNSANELPPIQ